DPEETPPTHAEDVWETARHWLVTHTFAPPWLSGRWTHPAIGYLAAVLLQVITVMCVVVLVRLFPSFQFQAALVILCIVVVALNWGMGPSLLATVMGGALLVFLLLPPLFSPVITRIEDA